MAAQAQQASRKRQVNQLDTPLSTVSWPEISSDDQDTILELLCELLRPLGQHRRAHIKPSRGKRAAKREKQAKEAGVGASTQSATPPKPELENKIDVGLNCITKRLEASAHFSPNSGEAAEDTPAQLYSMVFVARGNQSSAFNCHFPQMVGSASKRLLPDTKTRLVGFSKPCFERLSNSLGIARVSSIAILHGAPGAAALWEVVQKTVEPVDIAWLDSTPIAEYRPAEIRSTETTIGTKRVRQA